MAEKKTNAHRRVGTLCKKWSNVQICRIYYHLSVRSVLKINRNRAKTARLCMVLLGLKALCAYFSTFLPGLTASVQKRYAHSRRKDHRRSTLLFFRSSVQYSSGDSSQTKEETSFSPQSLNAACCPSFLRLQSKTAWSLSSIIIWRI